MGRPRRLKNPGSDRAVAVINNLTHTKGRQWAGQPFRLRPWQERQIIRPLFETRPDGVRRYRTCLLMLPRKNGKTELAAAIAVYGLLFDQEPGAEVYSAAADREQASLVYHVAVDMIRNDPELEGQVEIVESQKRIIHRKSSSVYRAISAEAYSKHGFNASMVIYDELHAAPNRDLWDVLTTSMGARTQPLTLAISTAGYDRHSILWELYQHAQRVQADPSIDPTFLPILYGADAGSDWQDETVWRAANPALEDFRSIDEMREACRRAKEIPAQENIFRRLYLNQWTEQAERWMPIATWNGCERPIDWADYRGRRCFVGMDLSTTDDITAIVAVFPEDDGTFAVLPCCFAPADTIRKRSQVDRRPYDLWARQGHLMTTPGNQIDYQAVRATLQDWGRQYDVQIISYDPWNAHDIVQRLEKDDGFRVVPLRPGYADLNAPTKSLGRSILSGRLHHDGHPVLADHIANAAIETNRYGDQKLSKRASFEKIDAAMALCCAIDAMDRNVGGSTGGYADQVFFVGAADARATQTQR